MSIKGFFNRLLSSGDKNKTTDGRGSLAREMAFRAFHHAPNLMAISNLENGVFLDVNESFVLSLGYEKSDVIGRTSDEILVFPDIESSKKYLILLSKFSKVKEYPVSLRMKSGDQKHFLFSSEKIRFGDDFHYSILFLVV